jgi:hypothetical protein
MNGIGLQQLHQFPNIGHNIPLRLPQGIQNLSVENARYIGVLELDLNTQFPEGNSFRWEPFVDGEEYIRLQKNNNFIFRPDDLQIFWNMGRRINPLTGSDIKQIDVESFTYEYKPTSKGGRKRRNTRRRKQTKKSRYRRST